MNEEDDVEEEEVKNQTQTLPLPLPVALAPFKPGLLTGIIVYDIFMKLTLLHLL